MKCHTGTYLSQNSDGFDDLKQRLDADTQQCSCHAQAINHWQYHLNARVKDKGKYFELLL